jgi:hypothetical protein
MAGSTKRALQFSVALGGLVPVLGGGFEVIHGLAGVGAWTINHDRYLSGLLLAIGLGFWTTIADIEHQTARFRVLTALVVVGGLSRLVGVAIGDPLTPPVAAALVMELGVTPLLCLWQ